MTFLQRTLGAMLGLLLAGALALWWHTSEPLPGSTTLATARVSTEPADRVDRSSYNTALELTRLATGPAEQVLADGAMRLADHDLDLAFNVALRQLDAHPQKLSAEAEAIAERLRRSQEQFAQDQERLVAIAASIPRASPARQAELQGELGLEQSQIELDQYEIEEAKQDFEAAGGNLRQRIEAESQERELQEKQRSAQPAAASPAPSVHGGMVGDLQQWQQQSRMRQRLLAAADGAAQLSASLASDRQQLAAKIDRQKAELATARDHESAQDLQALTQGIAADQNVLTLYSQRVRAQRSLSQVYQQWGEAVAVRSRAAVHALAGSLCAIFVLLLVLLFLDRWLQRAFARVRQDRRRVETLHNVSRTLLQLIAVVAVLIVLLGTPNQFGTVLGIIGAGLTVALKDFIVAFIGWMVLMGRNGMRLGDWVEINGVSGEVIELGMFHTVLLETGSWGDSGHPTGRRVTFTNSFAIGGHYFNFSTSGQWLWDELLLVVPHGRDPHPIIEALRQQVTAATAENARQAELEWQRAVPSQSGRVFSGTPGIDARPVVGGIEVSMRYITRADERFQLRGKLYQAAVDLLGEQAALALRQP
jgi:small-conductance mechanosensitive channel